MRSDLLRPRIPWSCGASGWGIIFAFLFTIALSDAPRLHEHLHKQLGADHECAVTMFTHGNCDRLPTDAPGAEPATATWTSLFLQQQLPSMAEDLEFSLLEHAPPVLA